ncbi:hypothetical protein EDC04DRAFT_2555996 [Pisolithus marmoratus]|nr:hypothetical protein EDC04DRAFT_2555996 [Pisolithus marmoratus]
MSAAQQFEKKGHICPPSNAKHPSDRWESLFVYSFICRFTNLRGKVEGLETPMDFENALLSREPDPVLSRILQQFILNLRPQTRLAPFFSADQISSTVSNVLSEAFKSSERTVFWDDQLGVNVDPFAKLEGGIFTADWDLKLKILRQLVELQLQHSHEIKGIIDRAWGVTQNKYKKKDVTNAPPDPADAKSRENLQLVPIGQDCARKRYWVVDDSPRICVSTNPWKVTATFQSVSSTREEYLAVIDSLKASAPRGTKKNKIEQAHVALIQALESRVGIVEAELARVQRVRRKIEQRQVLMAQAEIRETRTRRQTRRPDYDDADEYTLEEEEDDDDEFERTDGSHSREKRTTRHAMGLQTQRRSTRVTRGKRPSPEFQAYEWRGERRSSRLGASEDVHIDRPPKRARTEESRSSPGSAAGNILAPSTTNGSSKPKTNGAAAVKPTEVAVEEVGGKKKSKFWFYAVEPVHPPTTNGRTSAADSTALTTTNGHHHDGDTGPPAPEDGQFATDNSHGEDMDLDNLIDDSPPRLAEQSRSH